MTKIYTIPVIIILTALIIVSYGNLDYNGYQAQASHYISNNSWSEEKCENCHAGVYDDLLDSYHVQLITEEVSIEQWDPLFLDSSQTDYEKKLIVETDNINCIVCHYNKTGDADETIYLTITTDKTCANQCHQRDVPTRSVMWSSENYAEYDAHAKNKTGCIQCHTTFNHQIGRGNTIDRSDATILTSQPMKQCIDCHTGVTHGMVVDAHVNVSCESCHIPLLPGGQLPGGRPIKSIDWTAGYNDTTYQNENFQPKLALFNGIVNGLPRPSKKGDYNATMKPFNVINITWWDEGKDADVLENPDSSNAWGNPLPLTEIRDADANNDGEVTIEEMREFDLTNDGTPDYPNAIIRQLDLYYSVSHNIMGEKGALGEKTLWCADCHGNESRINWTQLGYESDPGETDPPTDFTTYNITVETIPARPEPVEVETKPRLLDNLSEIGR